MITLGVAAAEASLEGQARSLAKKLGLDLLATAVSPDSIAEPQAILVAASSGLFLQQTGKGAPGPVIVEFGSAAMRHRRRAGQNELLGRAVGVGKKPQLGVLDATAGLGRDSFVLADLGCRVSLCERHLVIAELLASGLVRARDRGDAWLRSVALRMELHPGDARDMPAPALAEVDVIYLDPMFPSRSKSASVKKEMALFQTMFDSADSGCDADALFSWSMAQDVARVVVKRPARAPELAGRKPSHVIAGKAVRYDVYVLARLG